MLEFLKDYAYEMSELSQALTVFGAMVIAIALAVPFISFLVETKLS